MQVHRLFASYFWSGSELRSIKCVEAKRRSVVSNERLCDRCGPFIVTSALSPSVCNRLLVGVRRTRQQTDNCLMPETPILLIILHDPITNTLVQQKNLLDQIVTK